MTALRRHTYVAPSLTAHGEARLRTRGAGDVWTLEDGLHPGPPDGAASTDSGTTATETLDTA
jgi:hypothetical protein